MASEKRKKAVILKEEEEPKVVVQSDASFPTTQFQWRKEANSDLASGAVSKFGRLTMINMYHRPNNDFQEEIEEEEASNENDDYEGK